MFSMSVFSSKAIKYKNYYKNNIETILTNIRALLSFKLSLCLLAHINQMHAQIQLYYIPRNMWFVMTPHFLLYL